MNFTINILFKLIRIISDDAIRDDLAESLAFYDSENEINDIFDVLDLIEYFLLHLETYRILDCELIKIKISMLNILLSIKRGD